MKEYVIKFPNINPIPSDTSSLNKTIEFAKELNNEYGYGENFTICKVIDNEEVDWVDLENPVAFVKYGITVINNNPEREFDPLFDPEL